MTQVTVPPMESEWDLASTMRCREGLIRRRPEVREKRKETHLLHQISSLLVRASYGVLIDLLAGNSVEKLEVVFREKVVVGRRFGKVDLADGRDESDDLDTVSHLEVALSDGTSSDTA
jgi:hypothetical protein